MPRTSNSQNLSYYHFKIIKIGSEKEVIETKYFKTVAEGCDYLSCSRFLYYKLINDNINNKPNNSKNYKHFIVEKIHEPIFKQVQINY